MVLCGNSSQLRNRRFIFSNKKWLQLSLISGVEDEGGQGRLRGQESRRGFQITVSASNVKKGRSVIGLLISFLAAFFILMFILCCVVCATSPSSLTNRCRVGYFGIKNLRDSRFFCSNNIINWTSSAQK